MPSCVVRRNQACRRQPTNRGFQSLSGVNCSAGCAGAGRAFCASRAAHAGQSVHDDDVLGSAHAASPPVVFTSGHTAGTAALEGPVHLRATKLQGFASRPGSCHVVLQSYQSIAPSICTSSSCLGRVCRRSASRAFKVPIRFGPLPHAGHSSRGHCYHEPQASEAGHAAVFSLLLSYAAEARRAQKAIVACQRAKVLAGCLSRSSSATGTIFQLTFTCVSLISPRQVRMHLRPAFLYHKPF